MTHDAPAPESTEVPEEARYTALQELEDWLEAPVAWLGLAWLVLLVVEFVWGLNPLLEAVVYVIWGIFVLDFGLRLILAPDRWRFLRSNWLTLLSLLLPALRVLAFLRASILLRLARGLRGTRLIRVVGSLNRGMRSLRAFLDRRKFGYVVVLTLLVTAGGAAGMWSLESEALVEGGFTSYGDALWWTAMLMTTVGSAYWPQTAEGRTLTLLLALYAFSVFGYLTASLASYFIGREAASTESDIASQPQLERIDARLRALQAELEKREH